MMGQEPGAEDMLLGRLEQTREVIEKYVSESEGSTFICNHVALCD